MRIAIINSVGFWQLGWAIEPKTQQPVLDALTRGGFIVDVYEVDSEQSLRQVIEQIKQQPSLVWANAYHVKVNSQSDDTLWLSKLLEQHHLPFIGSGSYALRHVLPKNQCQTLLSKANISIPKFTAVCLDNIAIIDQLLILNELEFPLFVKPNAQSSSVGISQDCIVDDKKTLLQQIKHAGENYGYPVMVEEFLPGDDITISVFNTGVQQLMLPTYYSADNHHDEYSVLDRNDHLQHWGGSKQMRLVTEPQILEQIPRVVLPICEALKINDVTRIDCRLDRDGQLKAFDVNGLPGFEYPNSVSVWQMITQLPHYSQQHAFDVLIYLVVYCAARRHDWPIPEAVEHQALAHMNQLYDHSDVCLQMA